MIALRIRQIARPARPKWKESLGHGLHLIEETVIEVEDNAERLRLTVADERSAVPKNIESPIPAGRMSGTW